MWLLIRQSRYLNTWARWGLPGKPHQSGPNRQKPTSERCPFSTKHGQHQKLRWTPFYSHGHDGLWFKQVSYVKLYTNRLTWWFHFMEAVQNKDSFISWCKEPGVLNFSLNKSYPSVGIFNIQFPWEPIKLLFSQVRVCVILCVITICDFPSL